MGSSVSIVAKIFSPPRHKDTKMCNSQSLRLVSWPLSGAFLYANGEYSERNKKQYRRQLME